MKVNMSNIISNRELLLIAIKHLNYSFADVKEYKELTDAEKEFISEDVFNQLFY